MIAITSVACNYGRGTRVDSLIVGLMLFGLYLGYPQSARPRGCGNLDIWASGSYDYDSQSRDDYLQCVELPELGLNEYSDHVRLCFDSTISSSHHRASPPGDIYLNCRR